MDGDKKAAHTSVHGGLSSNRIAPPNGFAIKGKTSVNEGTVREGTAPTPRSLTDRNA